MNPKSDDDLCEIFAHARRCEHDDAPVWRPELLNRPAQRPRAELRWIPAALVTASVIVLAIFLTHLPQHESLLSEALPRLLDSPPGELFASVEPSLPAFDAPSDFLLTDQFNLTIP